MTLDPCLTASMKINLKQKVDLSIRAKYIKLLGGKKGQNLNGLQFGQDLSVILKVRTLKEKDQ